MNLSVPPNLFTMLSYIAGPLSFNFLSEVNLVKYIFLIDPEGEYSYFNEVFSEFGFSSNLAPLNLQDTVVYLAIYIVMTPVTLILLSIRCL